MALPLAYQQKGHDGTATDVDIFREHAAQIDPASYSISANVLKPGLSGRR